MSKIFTPPNLLSLSRLLLLPLILYFLFQESVYISVFLFQVSISGKILSLILMLFCVLTDGLDGVVARKMGMVTDLGKILDHVTDKILTVAIIIALVPLRNFPIWAASLIFFRDFTILMGSFILLRGRKIVPTSTPLGKVTGFSYALMVIAYVLQLESLSTLFTVTSILFLFLSGFHYLYRFLKTFRTSHEVARVSTTH
jgi:CDP-diacylglycerol--glycerol-3-phosphate 3-phosphatidyltransferase